MDCKTAIYERRSIRQYTAQKLTDAQLIDILEAGTMAPSGMNLQHWHFVMLRSEEALKDCYDMMGEVSERFRPILEKRFANNPHIIRETEIFLTGLGGAPVVLLAFLSKKEYNGAMPAISGVAAAIENMLLYAHEQGLGSCWITAPVVSELQRKFEERFAPEKGQFIAMVTFGYPDEAPAAPPRRDGKYELV